MRQPMGDPGSRHSPNRTWVADPPPFGVSSDRFAAEGRNGSPDYHVAYRDVTQPPRWTAKGWVGMDDYIKPRRGTAASVYGTSSLAPLAAPPRHGMGLAPLSASCPNEVRLQELLNLQRRRVTPAPGPGAYEPRDPAKQHRRFRRQQDPFMDGPFFLDQLPDGASTRSKEIAALFKLPGDSGLGPGEYDGPVRKDFVMRSTPACKLSTSAREGRTPQSKSLSISRSIQFGIDWHVPIILQPVTSGSGESKGTESKPQTADGRATTASTTATPRTPGDTSADARAPMAERSLASYGSSGSVSPAGATEPLVGAPPPPPSHVSRAVRREQQRRPGDWDWNRLGQNYRTSWTTLHGGAYSHGDHTPPRLPPQTAPAVMGSAATGQPALANGGMQGIYPIQEESSGALEGDPSGNSLPRNQPQFQEQQAQQQRPQSLRSAPQAPGLQQQQRYPPGQVGGYPGQPQQQQQPYYVATFSPGEGAGGGGGGDGAPGTAHGRPQVFLAEGDVRRRRAAAELAEKAQLANHRVTDWQSKFAG